MMTKTKILKMIKPEDIRDKLTFTRIITSYYHITYSYKIMFINFIYMRISYNYFI